MLSFSDKNILSKGYILLYHEGILDSDGQFHVIIAVHGRNIKDYFKLINNSRSVSIGQLQDLGYIIKWGRGILNDFQIGKVLSDVGNRY